MTSTIGPRVVPVLDTWQAQNSLGLVAADFEGSAGVEKFATFLSAERAVTVEVADTKTIARVYASLTGAPSLVIEVPRKKSPSTSNGQRPSPPSSPPAQDALAPRVEAPTIDVNEPEPTTTTTTTDPIEPPPATSTALPPLPFFVGAVGGVVALRDVEVGGAQAGKVVPMQNGPVPSLSLHLALRPLVLMDQHAWWNDLLIEANGRHGFVDAKAGDVACTVDDDDVTAALSWRARLSDNPLVPRIGAGVSGSFERFTIGGCSLPVLSTSTTQAAGFARLGWNVVPGIIDVDVLGGARVPVVGEGSSFERPGILGQVTLNATPVPGVPFIFVRAVARVFESRLTQGGTAAAPDLVVNDLRSSFELQLGDAL